MSNTTGSLTAAASVTLSKPATDTIAVVTVSGTYGTVTFVIEGSVDNSVWFNIAAVSRTSGAFVSSTISPTDNTAYGYTVPTEGLSGIRVRTTAVGSGALDVAINSYALVGVAYTSVQQTGATISGTTSFSTGITLAGTTGNNDINLTDNLASACDFTEGANSYLNFVTTNSAEKIVPGKDIVGAKGFNSTGPTGIGIGYATGAGGAVTQITDRSTTVVLSKLTGQITTHNASLAAGVEASFTVTNTTVAATDTIVLSIIPGGTGTPFAYVSSVAAGSFQITVTNLHGTTADTSADVINFAVLKAVAA